MKNWLVRSPNIAFRRGRYMPRTSIKGQVLADLVAEFTEPEIEELPTDGNMDAKVVGTISQYCLPT